MLWRIRRIRIKYETKWKKEKEINKDGMKGGMKDRLIPRQR